MRAAEALHRATVDLGQCRVFLDEASPVFDRNGKAVPHARQHLNTMRRQQQQGATNACCNHHWRAHVNHLQKLAQTFLALALEVMQLAADEAEHVQRRAAQELPREKLGRCAARAGWDLFSLSCGACILSLPCAF